MVFNILSLFAIGFALSAISALILNISMIGTLQGFIIGAMFYLFKWLNKIDIILVLVVIAAFMAGAGSLSFPFSEWIIPPLDFSIGFLFGIVCVWAASIL
ncbi:MAG: hypothetical protein HY364_04680 [Candidatus Aenigmarchaeota archaeon]|nr:hypothetical protein [Candidatus Aenigmarchaeota archaeon]